MNTSESILCIVCEVFKLKVPFFYAIRTGCDTDRYKMADCVDLFGGDSDVSFEDI